MDIFIQQLINGLTLGAVYAVVALGYTMVYGIIELINFAHGDVFMVGSMVTMFLLTQLGLSGAVNNPIELAVLLVVTFLWAMTIMGIIGVIIERFAYRPLRNAPKLAPLITAIGVSFILENIAQILVGPWPISGPQSIDAQARGSLLGTQVSVLKGGATLSGAGNALILDGTVKLKIYWLSESILSISGADQAKTFKKKMSIDGVMIIYN